jgi:hypothetical protein
MQTNTLRKITVTFPAHLICLFQNHRWVLRVPGTHRATITDTGFSVRERDCPRLNATNCFAGFLSDRTLLSDHCLPVFWQAFAWYFLNRALHFQVHAHYTDAIGTAEGRKWLPLTSVHSHSPFPQHIHLAWFSRPTPPPAAQHVPFFTHVLLSAMRPLLVSKLVLLEFEFRNGLGLVVSR